MRITKCDICEKIIERGTKTMRIALEGFSDFYSFEICSDCGKPVLKLLKNKKLIKDENKKYGG